MREMLIKSSWLLALAFFATSCSEAEDDDVVVPDTDVPVYNEKPIVATVNFEAVWGDKDANIASMLEYIEDAKEKDVDILLFPELALTGYSADSEDMVSMAESVDGESATKFAELADEYDMYIAYGAPETSDDTTKAYNSLFVCTPDGDVESYQAISTDMTWSVEGAGLKTISTYWGDMGLSVGTEVFEMPEISRIYSASKCFLVLSPIAIAEDDYMADMPQYAVTNEYSDEYYTTTSEDYYRINMENNALQSGIVLAYANLDDESGDDTDEFIGGSSILGPKVSEGTTNDKYDFINYYAGSTLEDDDDLVYTEIATDKISWNSGFPKSSLFQPELYADWYSNIATAIEPTVDSDPICAVVNMNPAWADKEANYQMMVDYMEEAYAEGGNIIVFPELCLADYVSDYSSTVDDKSYKWINMIDSAETTDGEYAEKILAKAVELNMYVIYGTSEVNPDDAEHPYNSAFVADPNANKTYSYQKIHPVEGVWCSWGKDPLIVETPWGGMGISVCKDSYSYPELARYYAMSGCKLFINTTASGSYAGKNFAYNSALSTIASRDRMVVLSSDLVGDGAASDDDPDITTFPGKSAIIGQDGFSAVYYNEMSMTEETVYIATPDMSKTGFDASTVRLDVLSAAYGAL